MNAMLSLYAYQQRYGSYRNTIMERKYTHFECHCLYDEEAEMFVHSDGEHAVYSNELVSGYSIDPENCDHMKK